MEIPKLIILRGHSGSGKTTVAKKLQRELGHGTLLISQDVIRRDMLWVKDKEGNRALPLLMELVKYGRKNCSYTILEGILYADWYMPLFETALTEYGHSIYAYYYDLPFQETLKRHRTKANSQEFGEDAMRQWWREKDYIGIIPEQTFASHWSAEEAAEQILSQIKKDI